MVSAPTLVALLLEWAPLVDMVEVPTVDAWS